MYKLLMASKPLIKVSEEILDRFFSSGRAFLRRIAGLRFSKLLYHLSPGRLLRNGVLHLSFSTIFLTESSKLSLVQPKPHCPTSISQSARRFPSAFASMLVGPDLRSYCTFPFNQS